MYNQNLSRIQLFNILVDHFNLEEIKTLCFLIEEDFDNLGADSKMSAARELILLTERLNNFQQLVSAVQQLRPQLFTASESNPSSDYMSILEIKRQELQAAREEYNLVNEQHKESLSVANRFEGLWKEKHSSQYYLEKRRDELTRLIRSQREEICQIEQELANSQETLQEFVNEREETRRDIIKAKRQAESALFQYLPHKDEQDKTYEELRKSLQNLRRAEVAFLSSGGRLLGVESEDENQDFVSRLFAYLSAWIAILWAKFTNEQPN